jgi:hypothetical protein
MTHAIPPVMEFASWVDLESELDRWATAGTVATLWWRDDDAAAWTDALDRLFALAQETPVALAVIPATAEAELARRLAAFPTAFVLQHGWAHRNHAPDGCKKSELGADRPLDERCAELTQGQARLKTFFGAQALPALVPPWNRIGDDLLPHLPALGIAALSTMQSRAAVLAAPGLRVANVHVDLTDWRAGRSFIGEGLALAALVRHLRRRREVGVDRAEPTGILTHHLIQDVATSEFLARLLRQVRPHAGARFIAASQVFEAS